MPANTKKEAGAVVHLIEELSDARLRCDQLAVYMSEATRLIENSPYKDRFFEVAGHLIHAAPQTLHKVQKAIDAAAFAANRIDYEDLKNSLKPEKVQQLEQGLEGVRIRQIHRRSEPLMITPQYVAEKLRQIAAKTREGDLPEFAIFQFIAELDGGQKKASDPKIPLADLLDHYAQVAENGNKDYQRLAAVLRRMAGDNYVREFTKAAGEYKAPNESVVKRAVDSLKKQASALESSFKKYQSDPDRYQPQLENVASAARQVYSVSRMLLRSMGAKVASEDEEKFSRFEKGKPADPTQNMSLEDKKKWNDEKERNKDRFKNADSWKADGAESVAGIMIEGANEAAQKWQLELKEGRPFGHGGDHPGSPSQNNQDGKGPCGKGTQTGLGKGPCGKEDFSWKADLAK